MKVKIVLMAGFVFLGALVCFLAPSHSHVTGAIPGNLWTAAGQWSRPAASQRIMKWHRTEYGIAYAWLVHDAATDEPAWYVRLDERCLGVYLVAAGLLSAASGLAFYTFTTRAGAQRSPNP